MLFRSGIAVGALFTVGFTISLTNFHKTLFTDEGYLMLTIPVKPYYHIFTKFISSVIWSAASMVVFVPFDIVLNFDAGFIPSLFIMS